MMTRPGIPNSADDGMGKVPVLALDGQDTAATKALASDAANRFEREAAAESRGHRPRSARD
jgi:hypothetical protein